MRITALVAACNVDVQHHLERVLHRELLADPAFPARSLGAVPLSETQGETRARDLCRELG